MPLRDPEKDKVVLRLSDGRDYKVPWCANVHGLDIGKVLIPRMPETAAERAWMWMTLTERLVPGGSIRFMGPSLHG